MIRVLVADDHPVVRRGVKQILAEEPDMEVGGEARTAQETLELARTGEWDVVVLDITLPDRSGLEILKELRQARPRLPVLVLSIHPEDQFAVRVLKAGGAGYLTKETGPEALAQAIRKVVGGGRYISPSLGESLAADLAAEDRPPHETLSDREYQVLRLIGSGRTVSQIAAELRLSVKTVSTYRTRILEKMRMTSNAELTHYAIRNRLVS